jgi:lysophospholipase L1-like esterase
MNHQKKTKMKANTLIITLLLLAGTLPATEETWNILDKSMATWNVDGGSIANRAWTTSQKGAGIAVTQHSGYVNITKTGVAATNNYAFLIPPALTLSPNTPYSFIVKARVNTIEAGKTSEAHQISARLNGRNLPLFLKHGDHNSGYIGLTPKAGEEERYAINTSQWHVYRFVLYADNLGYDVYVDDIETPVFENAATAPMTGDNILRLGAESTHRCNMDIEYVRMGAGDFYSQPKITSIVLTPGSRLEGNAAPLAVTVNTVLINDNETLQVSLTDRDGHTVVDAVEAIVSQNKATVHLAVPAATPKGAYFVRAAGIAPIAPRQAPYTIYTARFAGRRLVTFGNSITIAADSWAYQTHRKLGFGSLYNGAISASVWSKREKQWDDGSVIRTQNYSDPGFSGITSLHNDNMTREEYQKRLNNCAVVHVQKYLAEAATETPDCVIFSYGTNDPVAIMGNAEATLQAADRNAVDVFTMAGALRWCIDTLRARFPGVKIYVALPLQASKERNKNDDTRAKINVLKQVCDGLSTPYFDCFNESGITEENQANYLSDGLHPNEKGKTRHAEYIIRQLDEAASRPSPVARPASRNASVALSAHVLNAGQRLSVQSLKNGAPPVDAALHDMTGKRIFRQPFSGDECSLPAPETPGTYLLTVRLADHTSNKFKIIIH